MIGLFGLYVDQLPSRQDLVSLLDKQMYASWCSKHGNIKNDITAKASLGGFLLLSAIGFPKEVLYDGKGRPFFADRSIDFNLSHTEDLIICAVETKEIEEPSAPPCRVGVDAECLNRIVTLPKEKMAERWFTREEQTLFFKAPTDEAFLRFWTRKEALVKWLGTGLGDVRALDVMNADETYGVEFEEYWVDETMVTLCHRLGASAPRKPRMLSNAELFGCDFCG